MEKDSRFVINFRIRCSLIFLFVLQPWAFQAREFLRKKLIGKEVCFTVEIKTSLGREYGMVYLGKGECVIIP